MSPPPYFITASYIPEDRWAFIDIGISLLKSTELYMSLEMNEMNLFPTPSGALGAPSEVILHTSYTMA